MDVKWGTTWGLLSWRWSAMIFEGFADLSATLFWVKDTMTQTMPSPMQPSANS